MQFSNDASNALYIPGTQYELLCGLLTNLPLKVEQNNDAASDLTALIKDLSFALMSKALLRLPRSRREWTSVQGGVIFSVFVAEYMKAEIKRT